MAEVVRQVDDVETLKALADPLRLEIMRCLMRDVRAALTVKEIAQELGEGQTKLYRHIKLLEKVGLIKVASTRVVSGIIEHQYQAAHQGLRISRDLLAEPGNTSELAAVFSATLDEFRGRLMRDILAGGIGRAATGNEVPAPLVIAFDSKLSAARALEFRSRLEDLVKEFNQPEDGSAIPVEFLLMYWSPGES